MDDSARDSISESAQNTELTIFENQRYLRCSRGRRVVAVSIERWGGGVRTVHHTEKGDRLSQKDKEILIMDLSRN